MQVILLSLPTESPALFLYPELLPGRISFYPSPGRFPWHLLHTLALQPAEVCCFQGILRWHYASVHPVHPEDLQESAHSQISRTFHADDFSVHILLPPTLLDRLFFPVSVLLILPAPLFLLFSPHEVWHLSPAVLLPVLP